MVHDTTPEVIREEAEADIAYAMKALSFQENINAMNDVHGVSSLSEEDDTFLDDKLAELEYALLNIPQKDAYYKAKASSPAYVCDPEFRLRFLRADNFDAADAASKVEQIESGKKKLKEEDEKSAREAYASETQIS